MFGHAPDEIRTELVSIIVGNREQLGAWRETSSFEQRQLTVKDFRQRVDHLKEEDPRAADLLAELTEVLEDTLLM